MTAAEHMAFMTRIYTTPSVRQSRKYRRNCAVTGFLRHSYIDGVLIQDRVLIEYVEVDRQLLFRG